MTREEAGWHKRARPSSPPVVNYHSLELRLCGRRPRVQLSWSLTGVQSGRTESEAHYCAMINRPLAMQDSRACSGRALAFEPARMLLQRCDFRLWRSAVGGAPRQQFVSGALSPRQGGAEDTGPGCKDRMGRLTGSQLERGT